MLSVRFRPPHPFPGGGGRALKFIKTVAVLLAVSVSLMVPSFAWDSDSFVGQDFYFYEPVINYAAQSPSLMADTSVPSFPWSFDDVFSRLVPLSQGAVECNTTYQYMGQTIPSLRVYPFYFDMRLGGAAYQYVWGPFSVPSSFSDDDGVEFTVTGFDSVSFHSSYGSDACFSLDLTGVDDFYTFSLQGVLSGTSSLYGISTNPGLLYSFDVYVNGQLVETFRRGDSGVIEVSYFIYNSPVKIDSIVFGFSFSSFSIPYTSSSFTPYITLSISSFPSTLSFNILTDNLILDGQYDQTQDDINDVEGLESQWGNSMTENFNALSLDTFTYPDGLTSGFALISGIFQDLWNTMGSYSILYVLPLTLAVVLLLIGRISKFAGQGRSSPTKEE